MISVAMFAAVTLIPRYAQTPVRAGYGLGTSATGTGLLLAPMAVAMGAAAPLSTRLAARVGSRAAFRAGAALATTTLAALGVAHGALWQFALPRSPPWPSPCRRRSRGSGRQMAGVRLDRHRGCALSGEPGEPGGTAHRRDVGPD
ncbi:hypothetical protein [Streptomyces sp. OE57]|uniref:hypothetical protein n=1 Tax=Streptomyces lacaronensis TaxID=3379885 RepID=UPI0039B7433D